MYIDMNIEMLDKSLMSLIISISLVLYPIPLNSKYVQNPEIVIIGLYIITKIINPSNPAHILFFI